MSSSPIRGRAPQKNYCEYRPASFDEIRREALLIALGEIRPSKDPPRVRHRGQLPDVDLSRLVSDPDYVPLLGRLANLLRSLAAGLDRLSGSSRPHLGESA